MAFETIGKYEIRGKLGAGAMGTVLDAFDPVIERRAALKILPKPAENDLEGQEGLARFKREAQAAGRLNHPNVVAVYDYGEDGANAWIAMELVEGGTLKQNLDRGERLPLPEILRVMEQMLAGLDYSHKRGVVHRDIKPANLMLTIDQQIKIADFGIARIENSSMTQVGTVMGTPSYMAPEQLRGEPVDARADIWASGVLFYQLLTGEKPFEGGYSSVMHKALNTEPTPPSTLAVTAPRGFDAVIAKALAKRPEDRFSSAGAFAEAIRASAAGTTSSPADADATLVARAVPVEPARVPPVQAPPVTKKGPPVALIGGGVAVLFAAGAGYFLLGGDPAPQRSATPPSSSVAAIAPAPSLIVPSLTPVATEPALSATALPSLPPASPVVGALPPPVIAPPSPRVTVPTPTPAMLNDPAPPAATNPALPAATLPAPPTATLPAPPTATNPAPPAATNPAPPAATNPAPPTATFPAPPTATNPAPPTATNPAPPTATFPAPPAATNPAPPTATFPAPPAATSQALSPGSSLPPQQLALVQPARLDFRAAASAAAQAPACGLIASASTDTSLTLEGVLRRGDDAALRRALAQRDIPINAARLALQPFDGPYCPALDMLRPVLASAGAAPRVATLGRTPFLSGDLLRFDVTMPDWPGHLYVAYFMKSGEVAHLVPSALHPAGAVVRLGEPRAGFPGWEVSEPFGTDLLVAVVSEAPLFGASRPFVETQEAYLAALGEALRGARQAGRRVLIRPLVVETAPR